MNELYREELMALFENPENRGEMPDADRKAHVINHLCGDEVFLYVKLNEDRIEKAMFYGDGCMLSQVTASLVTSFVEGKSLAELKKVTDDDILNLIGFMPTSSRMKCALLNLEAVKEVTNGIKS